MSSPINCYFPLIEKSYSKKHIEKFSEKYLTNLQVQCYKNIVEI